MAEEINQELGEMSQVLSTIITDLNRNIIKPSISDESNGDQDKEDLEEDPVSNSYFCNKLLYLVLENGSIIQLSG
jgi:hypothetical protein